MVLVTSTGMFRRACEGGYAIDAFSVSNMEIAQGITETAAELRSPVILQTLVGAGKYASSIYLMKFIGAAAELHPEIPIALHLDRGADFAACKDCVNSGFTSVMINYPGHSFGENIAETKKVVEYAHAHGVVVEAKLDMLADVGDDVRAEEGMSFYTRPEEIKEFVSRTGYDSLAIATGTDHGAYKFKPNTKPQLRLDILEEVKKKLLGFPVVLHGASSVPQGYAKIINASDGQLEDTIGVPEGQLRGTTRSTVCRININSDLCLGMMAGIHQHSNKHPDHFDPRQYLGDGRASVRTIVARKIMEVLGSNNRI